MLPFFDDLKSTYNFDTSNFKSVTKVDYAIGFAAVKGGAAQVTECYTTDGSVTTQGFVFLTDDKHGFPEFHPAPIVRDQVLQAILASRLHSIKSHRSDHRCEHHATTAGRSKTHQWRVC